MCIKEATEKIFNYLSNSLTFHHEDKILLAVFETNKPDFYIFNKALKVLKYQGIIEGGGENNNYISEWKLKI